MSDMNVQDFFKQWTSTRPNLKVEFHDAGIEAMAFAEAYSKNELSERQAPTEASKHPETKQLNIADVRQQSELFVSFARFVANYKHSYATAYEDMFKEWCDKRNI